MICEQLGQLLENEALTTDDSGTPSAIGYALDCASAYADIGVGGKIWLVIKTTVAADFTSGNETYQFIVRTGTGTDGTDINAGVLDVAETDSMDGDDVRLDVAGDYIWRIQLPIDIKQRYIQLFKCFGGTTPTISISASLVSDLPPSDYSRQTHPAGPMSPP